MDERGKLDRVEVKSGLINPDKLKISNPVEVKSGLINPDKLKISNPVEVKSGLITSDKLKIFNPEELYRAAGALKMRGEGGSKPSQKVDEDFFEVIDSPKPEWVAAIGGDVARLRFYDLLPVSEIRGVWVRGKPLLVTWFPNCTGASYDGKYWRSGSRYNHKIKHVSRIRGKHKVRLIIQLAQRGDLKPHFAEFFALLKKQ